MARRRLGLLLTLTAILATLACLPSSAVWTLGDHSIVLHRGYASYVLVRISPVGSEPSSQADVERHMRSLMIEGLSDSRGKWWDHDYVSQKRTSFGTTDQTTLANATIALQPVATAAWLAALLLWILIIRHRPKPGTCHQCGYDLTGNSSALCPECGAVNCCV